MGPGPVIPILEERSREASRMPVPPRLAYVRFTRDAETHGVAWLSVIFTRRLAIPGSSCLNERGGRGGSDKAPRTIR